MKLTNRMRLPEPIVRAVSNDGYTKGGAHISCTEMLMPAWMRQLRLKHADEIEEDVSERIWSLLGTAVHHIIDLASDQDDVLSETTLYMEVEGWKIKGQADHVTLSKAELCDFKVTTVWKVLGGRVPTEWVQQTNVYRRMLQVEKGIQVGSIAIIAILRDWSKREAARREDYPQAQVVRLEVPLWDGEEADRFIAERIRHHQQTEPEPCTDEEIWAKPTRYAVMKKGRQSAIRIFDLRFEAEALARNTPGGYVEERPGEATRCQDYCSVARFCSKWAADPRNRSKESTIVGDLFNA
jgi:hypothetical protein